MRFIRKGPEPTELARWKKANAGLPNGEAFAAIDQPAKSQIREQMLREQGHLCAYTMKPITAPTTCHIEHIQPQSLYPERAIDYTNLVLCAPEDGPCEYGAIKKSDCDASDANFVSPLHASCEARFRFRLSGEVAPATAGDAAARRTIAILALNHPILVRERSDAIRLLGIVPRTRGIGPRIIKPLSAAKARRLIEDVTKPDPSDRLPAYCIAIKQAAEGFARHSEQRAIRLARKPGQ